MVKSLNTKMDMSCKGTWYRNGPFYGNIIVGDNAFEFYNETKLQDYIQIPWDEITYVVADVYFGGKYIPRFEIRTKSNGTFRFSARNSRQTLRAIKARIPRESLRKAPSMGFILKHRFKNLGKMILKKKHCQLLFYFQTDKKKLQGILFLRALLVLCSQLLKHTNCERWLEVLSATNFYTFTRFWSMDKATTTSCDCNVVGRTFSTPEV